MKIIKILLIIGVIILSLVLLPYLVVGTGKAIEFIANSINHYFGYCVGVITEVY